MIRAPLSPWLYRLLSAFIITFLHPKNSPLLAERTRPQTLKTHDLVYKSSVQQFQLANVKTASLIQQMVIHIHYVPELNRCNGKKREKLEDS